jgi:protocatechuate 3,4-dioxygenase alpha subunit
MQDLNQLKESPSQTAGPYVHIGCLPNECGIIGVYPTDLGSLMLQDSTKGERITISGTVFDGTGTPLKDAMIEVWQADANGNYGRNPAFTGWGRKGADPQTGVWQFDTIKPGAVAFHDGRMMAPHITFWIVARGINIGLQTRMYFPDEANEDDPILTRLEHQNRVPTLIAQKLAKGDYRFDIHLQGDVETVFFDV